VVDQPKWIISKDNKFSSSCTWDALREKQNIVAWYSLVWFPLAIPKHAFLVWLAIKNALATGIRMLQWGFQGETSCVFCRSVVEDLPHLFFLCGFSKRVWRKSLEKCSVLDPPTNWEDVLAWGIHHWGKKTLHASICRLVFGASIYNIWRTRNEIRHGGSPLSEDQLLQKIHVDVRSRILGKGKFKKIPRNIELCCNWGLSNSVLV
jgi:hypothetical protein